MSTPQDAQPMASDEAYKIIDGLSERQRDVLGAIAMNEDGGHHPKTLASLLSLGLIEEHEQRLGGRFPVIVKRYSVPLFVHIAWCQWCTDNVIDEVPHD